MDPTEPQIDLPITNDDENTRRKPADGDVAAGSITDLPLHLTEKILGRISPLETVRLAAVCKPLAAAVSARIARPGPHLFALEVAAEDYYDDDEDLVELQLRLPSKRRRGAVFSVPIDEHSPEIPAQLPTAVGSHEQSGVSMVGAMSSGRVAFVLTDDTTQDSDISVVLVNPLTGAFQSIELGPFARPHWPFYGTTVLMVPAGPDAFFVLVTDYLEDRLSLCRRSANGGPWSMRNLAIDIEHKDAISLATCSGGIFYVLDKKGSVFTVDASEQPPLSMKKLPVPSPAAGGQHLPTGRCYLLESDGEVLFVESFLARQEDRDRREPRAFFEAVRGFEVRRLDTAELRWAKVERLAGDRALFVSEQSSFAVRASQTEGCAGNRIYFVHDGWQQGQSTWGVYSMEEREVLFQRTVGLPGLYAAARWFFPSVSVGQRL